MDLRSLAQILTLQVQAMRDAPIPPAVAVLLAVTAAWLFLKWRYTTQIEKLRRAVARRDAELANFRAHAGVTLAAAPADAEPVTDGAPPPSSIPTAAAIGRSKPLRLILNAIEEADMALRSANPDEAERAMASMGLALRTASSAFALPVPAFGADPVADIRLGKRFLESVRPPLRAGDDDEARRVATAFLAEAATARNVAAE